MKDDINVLEGRLSLQFDMMYRRKVAQFSDDSSYKNLGEGEVPIVKDEGKFIENALFEDFQNVQFIFKITLLLVCTH